MKLVDILARELKVWPKGVPSLSQLQHNGAIINGNGYDGREWDRIQIADDTPPAGALVTESQWQTAVDALKASENSALEWNGDGLPPVGTVCEYTPYHISGNGYQVEIIAHFRNKAMVAAFIPTGDGGKTVDQAIAKYFRPIRTPDQIAEEARQKAINQICIDAGSPEMTPGQLRVASKLYDAGYRKFEIVDN